MLERIVYVFQHFLFEFILPNGLLLSYGVCLLLTNFIPSYF